MNVVSAPVNKRCSKCKELLPVAFFCKKTKSKDGLQDWCKTCQRKSFVERKEAKKKKKRNQALSVLSYYKNRHNLDYHFTHAKTKGRERDEIEYTCLNCGTLVKSKLKDAINNKFKCDHCLSNNNEAPLFNISNHQEDHNLLKDNCCDEFHNEINQKVNKLIKEMNLENDSKKSLIKVFIVPVQQPTSEIVFKRTIIKPQKKQNRFTKWFKWLFGKNDLK